MPGLQGPSPLLRLQSDERLIALTRKGQTAAFETLCSRYQSRLLSFCRHMLSSREDAEDVLQEVFAAAFNAVLADEREINVRPWLYRIARNRSLNHLRRASAIGVDSMDVHFADHGLSTGDRVIRREGFRQLLGDVQQLPETQRTALLLREIDALSYEQIAHAMETTIPSVKSLLVRARISLAEAAEARKLSCAEVRLELGEAAEGLTKLSTPARRHTRDCDRCRSFKRHLKDNNQALAMILPVGPLLIVKKLLLAKLGISASAGSAHVAGGAGATAGAGASAGAGAGAAVGVGAGAGAAGGAGASGGILTFGALATTKAVAGLAAAVIVTAGAVAVTPSAHHYHAGSAHISSAQAPSEPLVVSEHAQPLSASNAALVTGARHAGHRKHHAAKAPTTPAATTVLPTTTVKTGKDKEVQITEVTSGTTELPGVVATGQPAAPTGPSGSAPTTAPPVGAGTPPPITVTSPPVTVTAPPVTSTSTSTSSTATSSTSTSTTTSASTDTSAATPTSPVTQP